MKSYRLQDGCWNCEFSQIDTWEDLVCNHSNDMPQMPNTLQIGLSSRWDMVRAYTDWAEQNLRDTYGICDHHKIKECARKLKGVRNGY